MINPIPDDWDGVTWRSVCIEFPESDHWLALLNGMLSQFKRGRFWDERTGSILDVIAIGSEIWDRNADLPDCEGNPTPPEIIEIIRHVGCQDGLEDEESEENFMGCGPIPFKEENGKLYYYHCCEWVEIFARNGEASSEVEDPYADNDPAPTYSACSKAKAIVDIIYGIADVVWENQNAAPWTYVGLVEDYVIGHNDLDDNQIISAFLTAIVINTMYDFSDIFDPSDKAQLLCGVAALLDDTAAGITRAQWDQMIGIINTIYGEGIDDFFRACAESVGPSDMREITALMSLEAGYNCDCPEVLGDPTGGWDDCTWVHFWNYAIDDYTAVPGNVLTVYAANQGFVDWADESTRYAKTGVDVPFISESATLLRVWFKFHVGIGFDWSGDTFRMTTDAATVFGPQLPGGDPVTSGGDITLESGVYRELTAGDNKVSIIMEGHVNSPIDGATDPDSPRLIAFAIGGTGTDPFA